MHLVQKEPEKIKLVEDHGQLFVDSEINFDVVIIDGDLTLIRCVVISCEKLIISGKLTIVDGNADWMPENSIINELDITEAIDCKIRTNSIIKVANLSIHEETELERNIIFSDELVLGVETQTLNNSHAINGILNLNNFSGVFKWPKDFVVNKFKLITGATEIKGLPDNLVLCGLNTMDSRTKIWPNNLTINGDWETNQYDNISWIPKNTTIYGDLNIKHSMIRIIPESTVIYGSLIASHSKLRSIQEGAVITEETVIDFTQITEINKNTQYGKTLNIRNCNISRLTPWANGSSVKVGSYISELKLIGDFNYVSVYDGLNLNLVDSKVCALVIHSDTLNIEPLSKIFKSKNLHVFGNALEEIESVNFYYDELTKKVIDGIIGDYHFKYVNGILIE
ncbi:hypothetical protein [Photobacterium leiognathi]|uniref:hypothetical protein n=1 Tax=Photobacterium leiognathi TaxID=553611 RepID=UPI002980EFC8|nr:hypothetical protein [Photobacterium leiognathi]